MWKPIHFIIALLLLLPATALLWEAISGSDEVFQHIFETVLVDYAINSILLTLLTMVLAVCIGFPLAWLVVMCEFPGVRHFRWLLILPLAMPPYLLAYLYTDLLDYAGPVQSWLRSTFSWQSPADYWFFDLRTLPGAAMVLALVLYPYIYLLLRAALREQSVNMFNSSRMLGASAWKYFRVISLPLMRPALVAGMALVGMESLADFATVHYFSVSTLTTAVYDTWLGHSSLTAAAKISVAILVGVVILVSLERISRYRMNYAQKGQRNTGPVFHLSGARKWLSSAFCFLILFLSLIFPMYLLFSMSVQNLQLSWQPEFVSYIYNSLLIALISSLVCLCFGLLLVAYQRLKKTRFSHVAIQGVSMGYAIPGTVLAIAVLIPFSSLDHWLNQSLIYFDITPVGLIFTGSVFIIISAYVVRFMPLVIGSVESTYARIPHNLDLAAKTLGQSDNALFTKIHWPLLKRGLIIAAIMVFLESIKELPAALLLRPFNFETLATWVYSYVIDEQLEQAALGAVIIIVVGLIAVVLLNKTTDMQHNSHQSSPSLDSTGTVSDITMKSSERD